MFDANWIWILIPLAGIFAGMWKELLKFRAQGNRLGDSAKELERDLAALKTERAALVQRIENLEAIVVSQTWGAVHDRSLPEPVREQHVAATAHRELGTPAGLSDQQRAQLLAQRLQR
jgi:seryl-tRNA synthetase